MRLALLVAMLLLAPAIASAQVDPQLREALADAPKRGNGSIDYAAALNAYYGEGVKNEDNAFVPLLMVSEEEGWDEAHRAAVFAALKLERPGPEVPQFTSFKRFQEQLPPAERHIAEQQRQRALEQPWTDADCPHIAKWLDVNKAALDYLAKALQRPHYFAPIIPAGEPPTILNNFMPQLYFLRQIATAWKARALRAVAAGDFDAAARDAIAIYRIASHASHDHGLIAGLVALSVDHYGHHLIETIAADARVTAAQLAAIRRQRSAIAPKVPIWKCIDAAERALLLDAFEQLRYGLTLGELMSGIDEEGNESDDEFAVEDLFNDPEFDHARARQRLNNYLDPYVAVARCDDFNKALELIAENDARFTALSENLSIVEFISFRLLKGPNRSERLTDACTDLFFGLMVPALHAARESELKAEARNRLGTIALALAAHRIAKGGYPASLAALAPEYADAIPVDPFTGEPMRYRVEARRVIIYSLGPDQQDNGGLARERFSDEPHDIVVELPIHSE